MLLQMPPQPPGAIAGEGAVAHGQRAMLLMPPPPESALLPEKVLLLTVSVLPLL